MTDPGFEIRGGGAYIFRISNYTPLLESFPKATIKVYTCILIGFRFAHPLVIFPEATMKVYTWIFLGFGFAPPLIIFPDIGTLSDGNVHVKFHDDRLRNGGDITY